MSGDAKEHNKKIRDEADAVRALKHLKFLEYLGKDETLASADPARCEGARFSGALIKELYDQWSIQNYPLNEIDSAKSLMTSFATVGLKQRAMRIHGIVMKGLEIR